MRKIKKQMLTFLIVLVLGVSIILTACKKTTSYTYSFNVDGGVSIGDVSVEEGSDYALPTTAEKEGYVFEGWYDNPEFSGDAVTSVKATANLTFYAKWTKLYVATLDLNGGALSTTSVSVKVGANLKDALKDLNPTKSGVTFAGWFKDGKVLAASDVMPAQDISLVAKYQQTYKIEYYQQKMDGSGYDKTEETGSAIVGETFAPEKKFEGFNEVTKSDSVASVVISEDASKNVLKKYYDRNQCKITLDSNYPTDKENVVTTKDYIGGSKIDLTNDFACEGYLLVGWSDSKDGEVLYQVNPITSVYNDAEGSGLPASTEDLVATETKTLYAVWKKGYTDMFGGKDSIYLFEDKIFLNRYDLFFKGEYNANNKSFSFYDSKDNVILDGKFVTDTSFAYYSEIRDNGAYTLVDISGPNENVMLYFLGGYNGCKYSVKDKDGKTAVSEGTYLAVEGTENEYVITFTEGPLADQKLHFFIGVLDNKPVFKVRNDAELELSKLGVYTLKDGVPTLDENAKLTFDGYGSCTLGKTDYLCSYDSEKGVLTLYSTSGELAGYLKVVEYNNKKGLADYVEELDHTYQSGADTLTLDGVFTATYKKGSEEIKGTYSYSISFLSFAVIDFETESESYKFTLTHDTEVNEANPEESTVNYLFNKVEKEYGEYLYLDAEGLYYAPLIVTENATQASLYGYTEEREYVKVSSGTYSLDEATNRYTYTVTETFDGSTAMVEPFDLTKIQSIVYQLETVESYLVNYWYEYKNVDGTTTLEKEYTWDTEIKGQPVTLILSLVADKASVKGKGNNNETVELLSGTYSQTGTNVLTIELSDGSGTMVVELNEENKTFEEIFETFTMYEYKNNEVNKNAYFFRDKTGKWSYVVEKPGEGDAPATKEKEVEGTIEPTNETTKTEYPIYQFTSKDGKESFKLIILATNTDQYFARYDSALDVSYTGVEGSEGGYLELDGYGFQALAFVDGEPITGVYTIDSEKNVITFTDENDDLYFFDINPENKTYTLRGYEYGSYFLLNNQAIDYFVKLDGYGKAEILTISGEKEEVIDDKATYTINEEEGYLILTYTVDNKQITDTCVLTTYILSGDEYPAIAVSHKEVVSKYVNEADWSILLVDEFGLATLYNPEGFVQEGSCSILSTNLLYFVSNDGTYAGIYEFDINTGSLSQTKLRLKGYYTSDFESLIFTDYGLVIDNGSANSYYNVEEDKIIVYSYEPKSDKANEYGYVQTEYGTYGDEQIKVHDKTYYINTGYAIEFNRADSDKLTEGGYKYPFVDGDKKLPIEALYFSPTGKEFNVDGQIKIDGQTYACTIVREKLADDTYNAYVVVEDQYYITIDLTYAGIDDNEESLSTFTVTGFKTVLEIPSFDYVYICWYLSQMIGQDAYGMIENTYGSVTLNWEYDETGAEKSRYANTTFADTAALKDSAGNEINLNESEYEAVIDQSKGTIYVTASVVAKDGATYNLYLESQVIPDYNHLGMAVVAMTRTQTITSGEYKVDVEQLVYYEGTSNVTESDSLGQIYAIKITQNETEIPVEIVLTDDLGKTYAVSRTYDDAKKITSTTYYLLEYTLAAATAESTYAPLYDTFTVTAKEAKTYYTADGKSYVDILADGTLEMISIDGEFVTYSNPIYDDTTKTYTYDVEGETSYKTYSIVITDNVATITFVKETPKTEVNTGQ